MIVVIFEVQFNSGKKSQYLDIASDLVNELKQIRGFVSIERFTSISEPNKILSLSFWRDEEAIYQWRNMESHREAQKLGRATIFKNYRLRIANVIRDYDMNNRDEAPSDSREFHIK